MKIVNYILAMVILSGFCACEDDEAFSLSPSERNEKSIAQLREELVSAPYGWKVVYFSKTDSLLFSDPKEKIGEFDYQPKSFSYGGKYFLMKFAEDGVVEMLSDDDATTVSTPVESRYIVTQNSMTQLSFTTYNYIHSMVNESYGGACDFLYGGKDHRGNMIFKTASYIEPAREYILFEKLDKDPAQEEYMQKSLDNRHFFEEMKNPQIRISRGDRIYFQSDRYLKYNASGSGIGDWERGSRDHRYYVFLYNKKLNPVPDRFPLEVNALGSGYVGTENGITFRSGIRYSKDYIFYHFRREGSRFVCELVKVYDKITRQTFYAEKELYPEGEYTGYIAVIEDKKIVRN